jgi:hypothetical protein
MFKPSKKFLAVSAILLLLLGGGGGWYFLRSQKTVDKEARYVDAVTRFVDVSKTNQETYSNQPVRTSKKFSESDFARTDAQLGSYVRTVCTTLPNKDTVIDTDLFRSVKKKFDEARDTVYADNKEVFRYNRISRIVSAACPEKGADYVDLVINYLQYEGILRPNPNARENLGKFVTNLPQTLPKVDSGTLASDEGFKKYFFVDNRDQMLSYYFPYYEMTKADVDAFFGKPLDTLEQSVVVKKEGITKLNRALGSVGMDIGTFRGRVFKADGVTDKTALVEMLKKDYDALVAADPQLADDLSDVTKFERFVRNGGVARLTGNEKTKPLYDKVIQDMTSFVLVSEDWAGGIYETWSGVQFMGDEKRGNGVIRLMFASLLQPKTP